MNISNYIEGAISTLPDHHQESVDAKKLESIWEEKKFTEDNLHDELNKESSKLIKSLWLKCIIALKVFNAQQHNTTLNISEIFSLIKQSLDLLTEEQIISRIGSQGFLSIPLFRLDKKQESFDLLRLHIWDETLEDEINGETADKFSIHSHQFHAHSWILNGKVSNTLFKVNVSDSETDFSHFEIAWKNNLKKVNERQSIARNIKEYVQVTETSSMEYSSGETYQIEAGDYHKSGTDKKQSINATLFLFSSKISRTKKSFVIGPSIIEESAINRSKEIDAKPLLNKLETKINDES